MKTTWERAEADENAICAWLTYETTLPAFKTRKSTPEATSDMFGDTRAAGASDDVIEDGRQAYTMRLPFTRAMLERRAEYGRDIPAWWKQVDTFTVEIAEVAA